MVVGFGLFEYLQIVTLRSKGITVEGRVVDSDVLDTGKGRTSYSLIVDYKPERFPTYRKQFLGVPPQVFEQATTSGKVPVRYLVDNPEVSALADQINGDLEPMAIGVGVFVVSLIIWTCLRTKQKEGDIAIVGENVPPASASNATPPRFVEAESIAVRHEGRAYEVSLHYRAREPEEDDILKSSTGNETYLVHPGAIYEQILRGKSRFFTDLRADMRRQMESRPCLRVSFMDESRQYHEVTVGDKRFSIPGKYQGLTFRLCAFENDLVVATEHMHDENGDELPIFVTTLDKAIVTVTSAVFDEGDQLWGYQR